MVYLVYNNNTIYDNRLYRSVLPRKLWHDCHWHA